MAEEAVKYYFVSDKRDTKNNRRKDEVTTDLSKAFNDTQGEFASFEEWMEEFVPSRAAQKAMRYYVTPATKHQRAVQETIDKIKGSVSKFQSADSEAERIKREARQDATLILIEHATTPEILGQMIRTSGLNSRIIESWVGLAQKAGTKVPDSFADVYSQYRYEQLSDKEKETTTLADVRRNIFNPKEFERAKSEREKAAAKKKQDSGNETQENN